MRDARLGPGSIPTRVTVGTQGKPFTFFLRDVRTQTPIFVPAYGVAVTEAGDGRSYDEIEQAVRARGLRTTLEQIASEPEENVRERGGAHPFDARADVARPEP